MRVRELICTLFWAPAVWGAYMLVWHYFSLTSMELNILFVVFAYLSVAPMIYEALKSAREADRMAARDRERSFWEAGK